MVNHYCTATEVKSSISFPSTGAPVSDSDITTFIGYAEEEIEDIYKTKFGNIDITSTATSGSTTTIVDNSQSYTANEYIDYVVWIHTGTNSGEYRPITSNTTDTLTVSPAFSSAVDNTSEFRIVKLGYKSQTVDGTGTDTQHVEFQPLISLNTLSIDGTTITPSQVYQYKDSGRLLLGKSSVEAGTFINSTPQTIVLSYIYGVYPMPQIIKRLCIVLAGIRTLTAQIAGTYDDFTNVSLPGGLNASKGEPYTNIREAVAVLQGEARGIIYGTEAAGAVTGDVRTLPSYVPWSNFG